MCGPVFHPRLTINFRKPVMPASFARNRLCRVGGWLNLVQVTPPCSSCRGVVRCVLEASGLDPELFGSASGERDLFS